MAKLPDWLRVNPEPREKEFFFLFEQSAGNAVQIAQQLKEMVFVWEKIKEGANEITNLGQQSKEITDRILDRLHHTLVTPFDREDIALLARSLDRFIHAITAAAKDLPLLHKHTHPTTRVKEIADIVTKTAEEIEKGIVELNNVGNGEKLLAHCGEIDLLEAMGVDIYRSAKIELAAVSKDVFHSKKWGEIYDRLEIALNGSKHTANVLRTVAMKHL